MASERHDETPADRSMISDSSPYQPTTEPVPHRRTICAGLILDTLYVKSIHGLSKMVEVLFCIVILICLSTATCNRSCSGISFLRVVAITSLVITVILFTVFALTLNTRISFIHWTLTDLLNAAITCLMYVISSSVLVSQSASAGGKAAAAFGFLNAILYGISSWTVYRAFVTERQKRKSPVHHTPGNGGDDA